MPLLSLLAFGLIVWLSSAIKAGAQPLPAPPPRVWSGVILATNQPHPGEAPERVRKYAGKLKNIFGYNQFELVGESSDKVDDPNEHWLVPSKDFRLSVRSVADSSAHRHAKIVLFQGRHRVAEFETHLNPESPLFIRGPMYAGGQLVIVVHAVDPSELAAHELRPPVVATNAVPNAAILREKEHPLAPPPPSVTALRVIPPPAPVHIVQPIPAEHFSPSFPGDSRSGGLDRNLSRP